MSIISNFLRCKALIPKLALTEAVFGPLTQCQQVRNKWVNCRMKKDARKRGTVKEYGHMLLRINAVRRNQILPPEIREIADEEIGKLPRDVHVSRVVPRCQLTSKPRNVVLKWRLGRMMFRHLADGNRLSGIQRAIW